MSRYTQLGRLDDLVSSELDSGFFGFNNRLRPDQLTTGMLSDSQNGRMDQDGQWQVRKGVDVFSAPLSAGSLSLTLPFYLYSSISSISLSRASDVITIDFGSAHNITDGTLVGVSGITGITPDPNGNRIATVIDSDTITITVAGITGTIAGTASVGSPSIDDDLVSKVYGSTSYSNPNSNNDSYIILAGNSKAIAISINDKSTTDIDYPSGTSVSSDVNMLQAFNKVFIFRPGKVSLEWDGDLTGSPAFTEVSNGDYTQPVLFDSSGNTVISDGVVTVDQTSHGLAVGALVEIIDAGTTGLPNGDSYRIATVPSANQFTFFATVDDHSATVVKYMKKQSVGLGFSHMPTPSFAVYHQRRLVMPFDYTMSGTSGSPTITDRGIRDEIIWSDILDSDTYDQIYNQFRFNAGTSDYLVGLHSFSDDKLLVFNRNSIYIVYNSDVIENAKVELLTSEVGCVSKDTITQVGNNILFLSDNGIYGVSFQDLYNLRGNDVPLSEPIEKTIKRINKQHWDNSVSVYFDNRYYIAVPLDDSIVNNVIIIFNFLNKQWESIDSIDDANWDVINLIISGKGSDRSVFAINSLGGIHKIDCRTDGKDNIISEIGGSAKQLEIPSLFKTRSYTLNKIDRKKWKDFELHIESSDSVGSDFDITFNSENIDANIPVGRLCSLIGSELGVSEDISVRARLANQRAYGVQLCVSDTRGRPKIRSLDVSGSYSFKSLNNAK